MAVAESWLKRAAGTWRRRYEGSAARDFARYLSALDFGNQIVLFGASLLLSVLPIVILLSAFATTRIDDDIARNMSLNAKASQDISTLFTAPHVSFNISILLALILSFAGTVGAALSIQQIYEKAFGHDHVQGVWGVLRCLTWVACVGGLVIADGVIRKPIEHSPGGSVVIRLLDFAFLTLFLGGQCTFCWLAGSHGGGFALLLSPQHSSRPGSAYSRPSTFPDRSSPTTGCMGRSVSYSTS